MQSPFALRTLGHSVGDVTPEGGRRPQHYLRRMPEDQSLSFSKTCPDACPSGSLQGPRRTWTTLQRSQACPRQCSERGLPQTSQRSSISLLSSLTATTLFNLVSCRIPYDRSATLESCAGALALSGSSHSTHLPASPAESIRKSLQLP